MSLITFLVIIVLLLISGLKVAQEYQRAIVFRLGRFQGEKGPGFIGLYRSLIANKKWTSEQKPLTLNNKKPLLKTASPLKSMPFYGLK